MSEFIQPIEDFEEANENQSSSYMPYKESKVNHPLAFLSFRKKDRKRINAGYNYIHSFRIEPASKDSYIISVGGSEPMMLTLRNFTEADINKLEQAFFARKISSFHEYNGEATKQPIIEKIEEYIRNEQKHKT